MVLLVIAHQVAVSLWNKAACWEFLWINQSLLFPLIHLLIPAQIVIAGNNNAALGGEVEVLDQTRDELMDFVKLFWRSAVGQIAGEHEIVQPLETKSTLFVSEIGQQRLQPYDGIVAGRDVQVAEMQNAQRWLWQRLPHDTRARELHVRAGPAGWRIEHFGDRSADALGNVGKGFLLITQRGDRLS